jgi:hypothetical protein
MTCLTTTAVAVCMVWPLLISTHPLIASQLEIGRWYRKQKRQGGRVMKVSGFKTWMAAIAITLLTAPAYALSLGDPGVVGAANGSIIGNAFGSPAQLTAVAQHLLDMAANAADPTGCALLPQGSPCYRTGSTDYNANLALLTTGAPVTGLNGAAPNVAGYQYVIAKYDGPNAGYVLFNVAAWALGHGGSTIIPGLSDPIWTNTAGNGYGISGYIGWGTASAPDSGATLSLLGLALAGIGTFRRFVKA